MKRFPGDWSLNCSLTAIFSSLSPFIRSMCPIHLQCLLRIACTKSKALIFALTSTCGLRPVILLRHLTLAPLIATIVTVSRFHVSESYVNNEYTTHLYTFIFSPNDIFELNMYVSLPIRAMARLM